MPALQRTARQFVRLSGAGHKYSDATLAFQSKLHAYMCATFVPLPRVDTAGAFAYWTVRPHDWNARNVSMYLKVHHGIRVASDPESNSLIINPPVAVGLSQWTEVRGALDVVADLFQGPEPCRALALAPTQRPTELSLEICRAE